jgi:hypothetical protein
MRMNFKRLNDRVMALIVPEGESSCEQRFAFVVFIDSPGGFGADFPAAVEQVGREETF